MRLAGGERRGGLAYEITAMPSSLGVVLALLPAALSTCDVPARLGAEFIDWPYLTENVLPRGIPWVAAPAGGAAATDALGWPLEDALTVVNYMLPSQLDPLHFLPIVFGDHYFDFVGAADAIITGPPGNVTLLNSSFDALRWVTSGYIRVLSTATLPAIWMGASGTRRAPGAARGTGFSAARLLRPGVDPAASPPAGGGIAFLPAVATATAPFSQLRTMISTYNGFTNPALQYSSPDHGVLQWSDRRALSDALWTDGAPSPKQFGVPWEYVVSLAQATRKAAWVCVPPQATGGGGGGGDAGSYVGELGALLAAGSPATGGRGLPVGSRLYVEHGNEVWLRGDGKSASNAYNEAAAADEVARGVQPWDNDGCGDAFIWGLRRHVARLHNISATLAAAAAVAGSGILIQPVLGWDAALVPALAPVLAWHAVYAGVPARAWLAGIAVNTYTPVGLVAGNDAEFYYAALKSASQAAAANRSAAASAAAAQGVRLMAYEGNGVGIAFGPGAQGEQAMMIEATRAQGAAGVLLNDYELHWQALGGCEHNWFALASQYDVYQWGLVEDLRALNTPRFQAIASLAARGQPEVGPGAPPRP